MRLICARKEKDGVYYKCMSDNKQRRGYKQENSERNEDPGGALKILKIYIQRETMEKTIVRCNFQMTCSSYADDCLPAMIQVYVLHHPKLLNLRLF